MPDEKFITRAKGGLNYQDTDWTQTQAGLKARKRTWLKTTQPAMDRMTSLERDYRKNRGNVDAYDVQEARNAYDKAQSSAWDRASAAEAKADSKAVTSRDATNARIARERLAARATAAGKPQPFITRKQAGINEGRRDPLAVRQRRETQSTPSGLQAQKTGYAREREVSKKVMDKNNYRINDAYRADMDKIEPTIKRLRSQTANNVRLAKSADVTARDAANAANARGRLAARATAAKAQPRGGGMMAKAAALGPVAEGAAALYAADEATGFRRTKYSGNSGGPSFSMNPYASSNKSSYAGQSAMSKAMGVGKKK
jgi:hypothetical protein